MAASGDVTFTQDGAKLHPYVIALVRWCVSCVWSAATVLLHRLMTSHPPPITAAKPPSSPKPPARPASSGHLHPEPLVTCQVLHQPALHHQDFIFIHGLYGSLENTWRQGDWRSKYKLEPNRVPLKRPASIPSPCLCHECHEDEKNTKDNLKTDYETSWKDVTFTKREFFNKGIEKVISDEELLMTEQFYNNTLLDQVKIVDNFEMQAQFVRELFECENMTEMYNKSGKDDQSKASSKDNVEYQCECNECRDENEKQCQTGCGCVCDKCYSPCWPKDWLKVDFPNARVISINYTSDPYLWRPLWVKESKRLRLHERAEQMTRQLLDLGVGQRPIVWVGHSKGGLFIKQIYCEAYEAFLKTSRGGGNIETNQVKNNTIDKTNFNNTDSDEKQNGGPIPNLETSNKLQETPESTSEDLCLESEEASKYNFEERSSLWSKSTGFMFYSVPHRGSALADIKTPITARSIELLEISKDNSLVLSLQARWLAATAPAAPLVRSLVETNRTLMAVLWLRIVSVESADAGIGALCGISVDHREICKPSSRSCILYKELLNLIHASLDRWRWNSL